MADDDDLEAFREAVKGVAPIKAPVRVQAETPKPPPVPVQSLLDDQAVQGAVRDEAAADEIEPRRLPVAFELLEWVGRAGFGRALHHVHHRSPLRRARLRRACARACSSTFSGVKPNLVASDPAGAEAPKVCMPMIAPLDPA